MLLTLLLGANRKFKRYAESIMAVNIILDEATSSGLYRNIAIFRVENNGGVPRLGHSIYFTCIEHRAHVTGNWRDIFKRWPVDRYGCEIILKSHLDPTVINIVEDGHGTIRTVMELEGVASFGSAILKERKGRELYVLIAGFVADKKDLPLKNFEVLTLSLKNVFKKYSK